MALLIPLTRRFCSVRRLRQRFVATAGRPQDQNCARQHAHSCRRLAGTTLSCLHRLSCGSCDFKKPKSHSESIPRMRRCLMCLRHVKSIAPRSLRAAENKVRLCRRRSRSTRSPRILILRLHGGICVVIRCPEAPKRTRSSLLGPHRRLDEPCASSWHDAVTLPEPRGHQPSILFSAHNWDTPVFAT